MSSINGHAHVKRRLAGGSASVSGGRSFSATRRPSWRSSARTRQPFRQPRAWREPNTDLCRPGVSGFMTWLIPIRGVGQRGNLLAHRRHRREWRVGRRVHACATVASPLRTCRAHAQHCSESGSVGDGVTRQRIRCRDRHNRLRSSSCPCARVPADGSRVLS